MGCAKSCVASRQRTEFIFQSTDPLEASQSVESSPRKSRGYGAIVGSIESDVAGDVYILQANAKTVNGVEQPGEWIRTNLIGTVLDPYSGKYVAQVNVPVTMDFAKIEYVNGSADQAEFNASVYMLPVSGGGGGTGTTPGGEPGTTIQTAADVAVPAGATRALPAPPLNTRRMVVQVTDGLDNNQTLVRIRELGGAAGSGVILVLYGSRVYGGLDGAIAPLEAENVLGPDAAVAVQFELD